MRFQPWLMAGIACFALSVALIGLSVNPAIPNSTRPILSLLGYGSLAAGALVILSACLFVLAIPQLQWWFGQYGQCDRAIKRRIRLGERLLTQPVVSGDEAMHWDALTQQVLRRFLGGEWHIAYNRYLRTGSFPHPVEETRRAILSRKLHQLILMRTEVEQRSISVTLDRRVTLSR